MGSSVQKEPAVRLVEPSFSKRMEWHPSGTASFWILLEVKGYDEVGRKTPEIPKIATKGCFLIKEFLDKRDRKANRLINEKSPYLLQHAYNPVDWYPWGEEAFDLPLVSRLQT